MAAKGSPQQERSSVPYEYSIESLSFFILSKDAMLALRILFLGTKGLLVLRVESRCFRGMMYLVILGMA